MERRLPYKVFIIDHEMVNAFAIAGGNMYVATGMLDFVKSDLELAGVIAHEMVHADKKHVIIQMARNERMTLLALAAIIASRGSGAGIIAANAVQVAVMGAYSIDIEKEADALGIDVLTSAGYNPVGMLTLQERLEEESMKRPHIDYGIYQTHPDTDERIRAVIKYMEDNDIDVNRKYALGLLRTNVDVVSDVMVLEMDDEVIWRGANDERTKLLFERIAEDLTKHLQLETLPFDVRVQGSAPDRALWVKGRRIVRESELPEGTDSLDDLRENIHSALSKARRLHPMADYFK